MRVAYVCEKYGSCDVASDAIATWDVNRQIWIVVGHYDSSECHKCDSETSLVEVALRSAA